MNDRPGVVGSWLHSHEEDTETTAVYRPAGHPFPPSRRPRRGMEFREDGTFVLLRPGPDDRPRPVNGRWQEAEPGRIRITLPEEGGRPWELNVISSTGDRLTIAK